MIFRHTWEQIIDGSKAQTRRLVKPQEAFLLDYLDYQEWSDRTDAPDGVYTRGEMLCDGRGAWDDIPEPPTYNWRLKWGVGNTYAVQPGRGLPAVMWLDFEEERLRRVCDKTDPSFNSVQDWRLHYNALGFIEARIRILKIRQERLQCISHEDAVAEGMPTRDADGGLLSPRKGFSQLWDSIHTKSGTTWASNPLVWVLDFELVGA